MSTIRPQSPDRVLARMGVLGLLIMLGCFQPSQIPDHREITSHASIRPIDTDISTAEGVGQEALQKVGYAEIIKLAEKAGFITYKSNVNIQLINYGSISATGFVPVFSRYAVAAAVASQADSPLPGPADIAAVGVVVIGLVDAGVLDGYLLDTLGGWLFAKAQNDSATSVERAADREVKEAERALKNNQDFRRWFHREYKADQVIPRGGRTNPDLAPEQVLDAYKEWLQSSMPKVK